MSALIDMSNKPAVVVDWATDSGKQLFHAIKVKYAMPTYVSVELSKLDDDASCKTASENLGAIQASANDYAMVTPSPRFPCQTKAATWLSTAYYMEQRDHLSPDVQSRIEAHLAKSAAFWQIQNDVEKIAAVEADLLIKAASYDTNIPLRSAEEITAASTWFCRNVENVIKANGVDWTIKTAAQVLDKASALKADLDPEISEKLTKVSCRGGCFDGRKVAKAIKAVKAASTDDAYTLLAIADTVRDMYGEELQENHEKLARALDAVALNSTDFMSLLAVDKPAELLKLSNESLVKAAGLAALTEQDWLEVGYVEDVSLSGKPSDLSQLTEDQSDRLYDKLAGLGYAVHKPRKQAFLSVLG